MQVVFAALLLCAVNYVAAVPVAHSPEAAGRGNVDNIDWSAIDGCPPNRHQGVNKGLWDGVCNVLEFGVKNKTYPGCTATVFSPKGPVFAAAIGGLTYEDSSPSTHSVFTKYDLASVTKVLATTSATMRLYQQGRLGIHTRVTEYLGQDFAAQGKEDITLYHLLTHSAGFPPDPDPGYSATVFGCPASKSPSVPEEFTCLSKVKTSLMNQVLANPIGSTYVYSDLSMITMAFVIGTIVRNEDIVNESELLPSCLSQRDQEICFYEAFVRLHVLMPTMGPDAGFLPKEREWEFIAPTWESDWRSRLMKGQVSDENAYAMGGVSGHAGLFANLPQIARLVYQIAYASPQSSFINSTTVHYFSQAQNLTQSSRALGWDTNARGVNVYNGCGTLSSTTFTHLGYTGTQVCVDPERKLFTVLLTNRCYPVQTNFGQIHAIRTHFNTEVQKAVDQHPSLLK